MRLEVDVYLVQCQHNALENIEKVIQQTGLAIKDITLQSLASAEAVLSEDEKRSGSAVIDIGGEETDIVAYKNDSIWHTESIKIGSANITRDLAYGLRTSTDKAEKIKLENATAKESEASEHEYITIPLLSYQKTSRVSKKAIAQIAEARAIEILTMSKDALEQSNIFPSLKSGVVLTGGGAMIDGLAELAEEIFGLPVRIGRPLDVLGMDNKDLQPRYATSIGLARLSFLRDFVEKKERPHPKGEKRSALSSLTRYLRGFFD